MDGLNWYRRMVRLERKGLSWVDLRDFPNVPPVVALRLVRSLLNGFGPAARVRVGWLTERYGADVAGLILAAAYAQLGKRRTPADLRRTYLKATLAERLKNAASSPDGAPKKARVMPTGGGAKRGARYGPRLFTDAKLGARRRSLSPAADYR
jgi:hypothetical protein